MALIIKLKKTSSFINSILERLCVFLLIMMIILVLAQIYYRYFLGIGIPWSEEVAKAFMAWMALLGAAIVYYEKSHVAINFFIEKLRSVKIKNYIMLFHLILGLIFFLLLIIYGIDYAILGLRSTSAVTGVPRFWYYLSIPVGGAFLLIQCISMMVEHIINMKSGDEIISENS